jgi:hypothetical protein
MNRRDFLKRTGMTMGSAAAGIATGYASAAGDAGGAAQRESAARAGAGVSIVCDPADPLAQAAPVQWAVGCLRDALAARGVPVRLHRQAGEAAAGDVCVVVAGAKAPAAAQALAGAGVTVPDAAESLALVPGKIGGRAVLAASGADARGLAYAVLECADRVAHAAGPLEGLDFARPVVERPANAVRSVMRVFASEVEDKPWFNDRSFWQQYLSMLAAQRFNRVSLAMGLGYDSARRLRDTYFHFAYPFLVSAPGHNVRAVGLPDAERDRNLEMLRFISGEAAARGLHFQLGLWTHAYLWPDSPNVNYTIEGLAPESHGAYCRDALAAILKACPAIGGVSFRIHGESGVPEGSYDFWKTVFEGLSRCGRRVELDMHAKGMDQAMIDVALATGLPVSVEPKFWAEHMGLAYHQAAIRPTEMPPPDAKNDGFFSRSSGSRKFLRYGYGDLMAEGRRYGVLYRMWPGTQRLLLWGDPATAAGYGRASSFCGGIGMELFEPLSFKGRKGSGLPGGRGAYADASLRPAGGDWQKYLYTYRLWGRLLYNPDADADVWRRFLRTEYGPAAASAEAAMAHAGRVLPLVTTAHLASAANSTFWPEMYTNMPIVDPKRPHPYGDTPSPKRFGTVSPLDPELFSRVDDFAEELLRGETGGKYSPVEVAQWLEDFSEAAARHLAEAEAQAEAQAADRAAPALRRTAVDVAVQAGLGRFFAWKLRAAVLYALYDRSQDPAALREAVRAYRAARAAWADAAGRAKPAYVPDITFGPEAHQRGNWLDRLPAIDQDIADMEKRLDKAAGAAPPMGGKAQGIGNIVAAVLGRPRRPAIRLGHVPPAAFGRGKPVAVEASVEEGGDAARGVAVRLHYRRVNQAESWRAAQMQAQGGRYQATIPGDYADSPYPLQYYFEVRDASGGARLWPGFEPDLSNQPYYVVRQA